MINEGYNIRQKPTQYQRLIVNAVNAIFHNKINIFKIKLVFLTSTCKHSKQVDQGEMGH